MSTDPVHDAGAGLSRTTGVPGWPPRSRDLGGAIARLALAAAWSARHPLEPFASTPGEAPPERYYYRAEDGWESPVFRRPPLPGSSGEPVLLAHGMGQGARSLDFQEQGSLASALHDAGFDVYVLCHRGDRGAVAPAGARGFDFDDIVAQDVPAALATVRRVSGFERVLWVGHAMGGQLLYAHAARGGASEIAAGVALCSAVRFPQPTSQVRLAALTARLLPAGWSLPTRMVQRALSAVADPALWAPLARDLEGPVARGVMLHAGEDVPIGLVHQVARWLSSGTLCDRHDRLDYLAGLRGLALPLMAVAATGDRVCPPEHARPALDAVDPSYTRWLCLGEGWAHLDPILGRQAAVEVFPEVVAWLARWRKDCW